MPSRYPNAPKPILRGESIRRLDGTPITLAGPHAGDHFNLTTCQCRISRIIHGQRYDTDRSLLVAGTSRVDFADGFMLHQLYRADDGAFFALHMLWWRELGFSTAHFIQPLTDSKVLATARSIVQPVDCRDFLLGWYSLGWLPRDDACVRAWAEAVLSADDCAMVLDCIDAMPEAA